MPVQRRLKTAVIPAFILVASTLATVFSATTGNLALAIAFLYLSLAAGALPLIGAFGKTLPADFGTVLFASLFIIMGLWQAIDSLWFLTNNRSVLAILFCGLGIFVCGVGVRMLFRLWRSPTDASGGGANASG